MNKYNFNKIINRKNTDCVKYDGVKRYFGIEDVKPLWVADMDFETPDFIIQDIQKALDHKILAYGEVTNKVYESIILWYQKRHNINIEQKDLLLTTGVVTALSACIEAFSNEGDEVIIQTPVYYPFFSCVTNNKRELVLNPLKEQKNYYSIDFNDLESKITKKTKLLILCSPHNPVGRVWNKKELKQLAEICIKHDIFIISDEIHSDLVFKKFHSMLSFKKKIQDKCIILNSPSKTFNTAGLNAAYIICKNQKLKNKLYSILRKREVTSINKFGLISIQSAYTKGDTYLKELLLYIKKSIKLTKKILNKNDTKITFKKPEATYLLWLNFKEYNKSNEELNKILLRNCGLALNNGSTFGKEAGEYFRLNIALPKAELEESLMKLKKEFN